MNDACEDCGADCLGDNECHDCGAALCDLCGSCGVFFLCQGCDEERERREEE